MGKYRKLKKAILLLITIFITYNCVLSVNKEIVEINRKKYKKTIEGFVLDEDGNGIYNADVIIPEKNVSTKTSKTGRFVIEFFSGGAMHIEVFKIGFLPASTNYFKMAQKISVKIPDIILYRSPMEEIVVTGTSTPKLYNETPVKTFVASKKVIEKKGAISLADSLEIITGVRVENKCQNCNFTQVRINGMEGKYSQILINGQPVISALAGIYALEQLPSNMIEKLEVVKGGGSALYGGNAIAGVINVLLKEPLKSESRFSFTQEFIKDKPNSVFNFNNNYVSKNMNTKMSSFANYQRREQMDYNNDGFSDLGELTNISFGSNFNHFFSKLNGKLKLNFNSIFEDRRGGNKFEQPEHFADIAESIRTYRVDFGSGWEQIIHSKSILKVNTSYSYTKRKSYYGAEQDPNAYGQTKNPVFFCNLSYNNFSLENHSIISGLSFRSDKIEDTAPAYNREINDIYTDFGFYVQDEIKLVDDIILLIGARTDKHSEIENLIVSPRASLLYKGIKNFAIRGTYSTGFRAPQIFDEDLHITQVGGEGQIIVNKHDLKEEKSRGFTLGIDFGKQKENKLYQFSISGFYNCLYDVFTLRKIEPIENAQVFERFNSKGAKVYGIEIEAGFKIAGKFEVFSGWTFQKSEYDEPEPDFNSRKMFRTPDIYGNLRIEWNILKFVDVLSELIYTGSMKIPHFAGYIKEDTLEHSDPFVVINLSLNKKISLIKGEDIIITASILNILDNFQKDLDKGIYRDAGYTYGPRFPQTFRIGIRYAF